MTTSFQPSAEPERHLPAWQAQDLEALMDYRPDDLKGLPDSDVSEFEVRLVSEMRNQGFRARTVEEVQQDIAVRAGLKKKPKPATADQHRWNIGEQMKNFRAHQARQRTAEAHQQAARQAEYEQQILHQAKSLETQAYRDWTELRQPFDASRKSTHMEERDQRLVQRVESQVSGQEMQRSTQMEIGFFRWLKQAQVFGDFPVEGYPPTRYDDISHHVDGIVFITLPDEIDGRRTIPLGVDFTTNSDEEALMTKLRHIYSDPTGKLKYGTPKLPAGQRFLRTVVSLDQGRMQRIHEHMFLAEVGQTEPVASAVRSKAEALITQYRDRDVFLTQVVDEIREQLIWGRELLVERGAPPDAVADHDALIAHLHALSQERQNLQARAREEVMKEGVERSYRTADSDFIRRAAMYHADAGETGQSHVSG